MTKRRANLIAHLIAYRVIEKSIGVGGDESEEFGNGSAEDQIKIEEALDRIAQFHFDRSKGGKP